MDSSTSRTRFINNQGMRGPSPDVQVEISDYIRKNILKGTWTQGDLIPTRAELIKQFKTTPVTVQKAMQSLIDDGFLVAKGRRGTFVKDALPHLNRYALLFPHDPKEKSIENAFFYTLGKAALKISKKDNVDLSCFYNMAIGERSKDYLELVRQLKLSNIAGIILAAPPLSLEGSPVLELPNIPRIAFMSSSKYKNISTITLDSREVQKKAFEYIKASGKRRPCVVFQQSRYSEEFCNKLIQSVSAFGLEIRREWIQFANQQDTRSCFQLARLLFSKNNKIIPDSLYIADDNMIVDLVSGINAELGGKAREIVVCAQANFPNTIKYKLPVKLFGFDLPDLLRQSIAMISQCRQGNGKMKNLVSEVVESEDCR